MLVDLALALVLAVPLAAPATPTSTSPATPQKAPSFTLTPSLSSVATRSGMTKTGRLDEVAAACDALKALAAQGHFCDVIGTSPEGRPLHALTLGRAAPGSSASPASPTDAAPTTTKPTLLVIGGIHAGEIDGKDATFQIVSELLAGELPGVLDVVTVVFVPVYNVDGHERFGKNHRPNQRGPDEMGWRVTSQNLNLNRDWTKAQAPETRALLGLLEKIDPVVVVDLHVTDGAQFQHDISVVVEPHTDDGSYGTSGALVPAAQALSSSLQAALTKSGHLPLDFYPSFELDDDPTSGITVGVTPARLTHGYVARRGRIGVLVETHSWRSYPQRVAATVDLLRATLTLAATQATAWKKAAVDVDAARSALPGKSVTLAWETDTAKKTTFDFQGYAYTRTPSDISGAPWTRYDETKKQVWRMPLWRSVKATTTTTAPTAYAVLPGFAAVVGERLRAHGITYTTLDQEKRVDADVFRAKDVSFSPKPYEGQMTTKLKGAWEQATTTTLPGSSLPKGSLIVPVAQPGGRLVVELFEPAASEALVGWGFFNAVFEQKEYMEGYVIEAEARAMLAKDPKLKAAFEARLKSDPAFAKDKGARLDFFYERHPAWDAKKDLLPVVRLR